MKLFLAIVSLLLGFGMYSCLVAAGKSDQGRGVK